MEEPHLYDWAGHYAAADTPWDLGGPHPELSLRLQDGELAPPADGVRALVPGAGSGHDALALARRGWHVTAVDLVATFAEPAAREFERRGGVALNADALALEVAAGSSGLERPFDLVWDHTFFCALPPARRGDWGRRVADLLRPGGHYVALVFPCGKAPEEGGPPFGMTTQDLVAVLGDAFELLSDRPVARPVAKRTWPERLARFHRR